MGTAGAAERGITPTAEAEGTAQGTSGYHVNSYDVRLDYDPASETLSGEATLDLVVKERRDTLDLRLGLPPARCRSMGLPPQSPRIRAPCA